MPRLRVTDIQVGENHSVTVNFGDHLSLVFSPHLRWHSRKPKWHEAWWKHHDEVELLGLEEVKLTFYGVVVVGLLCQPTRHIYRLLPGYHQRQVAHHWDAALAYLDENEREYLHRQSVVRSNLEVLDLLRRGRLPVDANAQPKIESRRSFSGNFPGRIGGL